MWWSVALIRLSKVKASNQMWSVQVYGTVNKKSETKCVSVHTCHTLLALDGGRQAAVSLLADDTGSAPYRWDFSTSIHLHAHPHTHTCKQTHKHTRLPPNDKDQVVHRKHSVIQCWFFFLQSPSPLVSSSLLFSNMGGLLFCFS